MLILQNDNEVKMAISNASNQIVKVNLIPGILVAGNSYWNITDNKIYIEPIGLRVKGNTTITNNKGDLTIKEMHAINAISMYDHMTASEVAKKLHLTPGTLTSTVDRLVKKGYVERIRSFDDRRVIRLGLTKKGRLMYRAHDAFHRKMVEGFLKDISTEQMKIVEKAIRNLEDFLNKNS